MSQKAMLKVPDRVISVEVQHLWQAIRALEKALADLKKRVEALET